MGTSHRGPGNPSKPLAAIFALALTLVLGTTAIANCLSQRLKRYTSLALA
jgi:hypothetical protein